MRGTEGSSLKKAGYLARKKTMHCKTSKLLKVQKHLYTYVKKKICPEFCFKMLFSMLMREAVHKLLNFVCLVIVGYENILNKLSYFIVNNWKLEYSFCPLCFIHAAFKLFFFKWQTKEANVDPSPVNLLVFMDTAAYSVWFLFYLFYFFVKTA
ncbi:hypothetical protein AB205_0114820, partial [Aquarana catesbeiana]